MVAVVHFDILSIAWSEQSSRDRTELRRCGCVAVPNAESIPFATTAWERAVSPDAKTDEPRGPVRITPGIIRDTGPSKDTPPF
jgi:hypothetical protein